VSGSPQAAAAAAAAAAVAGCGNSAALRRLLLTQLRAAEPTITYNRCGLRAVTIVVYVVDVVVDAAQYVISTTSSGQHSLHARWLDTSVSSPDLLSATHLAPNEGERTSTAADWRRSQMMFNVGAYCWLLVTQVLHSTDLPVNPTPVPRHQHIKITYQIVLLQASP